MGSGEKLHGKRYYRNCPYVTADPTLMVRPFTSLSVVRHLPLCIILCGSACSSDAARRARGTDSTGEALLSAARWPSAVSDSVVQFGHDDQEGRNALPQAVANLDTATLFAALRADSARSRWLKDRVVRFGWPTPGQASDSAAQAAWLILQHSPDTAWQADMLPVLEQLASSGALPPDDVAMLSDRVQVRRGAPQRYATQFTMVDGRLLPEPVGDTVGLDARRAGVGLPPMAVYVRRMQEQFKVPVVWPPPR